MGMAVIPSDGVPDHHSCGSNRNLDGTLANCISNSSSKITDVETHIRLI